MNKNIEKSSFKSSDNIQKKEAGPDRSVSDNQSSSVTLNELAMKARKYTVISSFSKDFNKLLTKLLYIKESFNDYSRFKQSCM